jgi:16S rRNA (guanine966-N2)-methyltransferase
VAPPGQGTRPTADRVRQALFDMIMHAEWGGRGVVEGAAVLDVFAGTGALGLEALSRGAASACFIESDAAALRALRANVAACGAGEMAEVVATDVFAIPRSITTRRSTSPGVSDDGGAGLVFLDPPYARDLVPRAIARLREIGRIASRALIVAEIGREEALSLAEPLLAERRHGAARIVIFRGT